MVATAVDDVKQARIHERRRVRYGARRVLWQLSGLKRVRACGRVIRQRKDEAGEFRRGVEVKVSEREGQRVAGYGGVATCGSVWACPVCSAKIAAERATELENALRVWQERGGRVAFATFTVRHTNEDALAEVWASVSAAWTAAHSGREWHDEQAAYGAMVERTITRGKRRGEVVTEPRIPCIRVTEVTHGRNGWHVHVHALLLLGSHVTADAVAALGASMFARWERSAVGEGEKDLNEDEGFKIELCKRESLDGLSEYLSKQVYEVARGDLKEGRGGNRTPFQILRGLVEVHATGDLGDRSEAEVTRDEAIWREWEEGSRGRRQVVWSHGLRADLLPDEEERSDEEIAEDDGGGDVVAVIGRDEWKEIVAARADFLVLEVFQRSTAEGLALLSAVRTGGKAAFRAYHSARQQGSEQS